MFRGPQHVLFYVRRALRMTISKSRSSPLLCHGAPVSLVISTIESSPTFYNKRLKGMKYSLPSRDLIADCAELMHEGYRADALLTLGGCDKTQPAAVMPLVRGNYVGITLYGGSILPGTHPKTGKHLDAGSVFECVGSVCAGLVDIEELHTLEKHSMPGPGC
eukprot:m.131161 g.131161  ORF g.131161 m.131161 type:complete len:162 (-) comp23718_c0_seq3:52-537(-)